MHSNYRNLFDRAALTLPQGPILSNRAGVPACARDERFGDLN